MEALFRLVCSSAAGELSLMVFADSDEMDLQEPITLQKVNGQIRRNRIENHPLPKKISRHWC